MTPVKINNITFSDLQMIPCYDSAIKAGFPSQADEETGRPLDLHELLIDHPAATFFVRVSGDSMEGTSIYSGDRLIVDRAVTARSGDIVVALIDGEFTVKRLIKKGVQVELVAENDRYAPIVITEDREFQVWGVVTYVIHSTR